MRIIVATCSAEYSGRLNARLPLAKRVILIKADSSCLIFSELGSYKPLNWMAAPCTLKERDCAVDPAESAATVEVVEPAEPVAAVESAETESDELDENSAEVTESADAPADPSTADDPRPTKVIEARALKSNDILTVSLYDIESDLTTDLGQDPGLVKDGVEEHLQHYLAEQIERIGQGARLVRREYPTPIGPVDIMAVDASGQNVAIEIKRHGGIDGVEQLTRYLDLLNKDPLLAPVRGIFAAQTISPQARVLSQERGLDCLILDYEEMKGTESTDLTLF